MSRAQAEIAFPTGHTIACLASIRDILQTFFPVSVQGLCQRNIRRTQAFLLEGTHGVANTVHVSNENALGKIQIRAVPPGSIS